MWLGWNVSSRSRFSTGAMKEKLFSCPNPTTSLARRDAETWKATPSVSSLERRGRRSYRNRQQESVSTVASDEKAAVETHFLLDFRWKGEKYLRFICGRDSDVWVSPKDSTGVPSLLLNQCISDTLGPDRETSYTLRLSIHRLLNQGAHQHPSAICSQPLQLPDEQIALRHKSLFLSLSLYTKLTASPLRNAAVALSRAASLP